MGTWTGPGRGRTMRVGRPSIVWLCGPDEMVGVQYEPRWLSIAQKETKEAPCTTKVNYEKLNLYREAVSRGTTLYDRVPCALRVCSGRFVCIVHLWDTVECTYDIKPLAVERRS